MIAIVVAAIVRKRDERVPRRFPDRCDQLYMSDDELIKRYRFPRSLIIELCDSLDSDIKPPTKGTV